MSKIPIFLVLISLLFGISLGSISPYSNTLFVYKNTADYLALNIRINGVFLYSSSRNVSATGPLIFQRNSTDYVELIFTNYSAFPGSCQVIKNGFQTYGSTQNNFYLPNNCSLSSGCDFKVDSVGTFATGVNLTISINNVPKIIGYNNGSRTIVIQKNDAINVQISKGASGNFGANFTTFTNSSQGNHSSTWYNGRLTTQVLLQNAYYILPLSGVFLYESTNVPVQIGSLPATGNFNVSMMCNETLINSKLISSNNQSTQTFPILSNLVSKSPCYLRLADSIYTYDKLSVTVRSQIPTSINFTTISPSTYYAGTNVSIRLNTAPQSGTFMVQLTCGSVGSVTRLINSNVAAQNFSIPSNFYGSNCTFNVSYPIAATNPLSIVVVGGTIKFITPQNGTRIIAGNNTEIVLSDSISNNPLTVKLDCGGSMNTNSTILPNSNTTQYFLVPANFYGSSCTFSVVNYPNYYYTPYPATVNVAQPVTFSSPTTNGTYIVNTGFNISLTAAALVAAYPVTITQVCQNIANQVYSNVIVGSNVTAIIPTNYTGSCTFSSSSNAIYNAADPNVTISIIKGTIEITRPLVNDRITAGTDTQITLTAAPNITEFTVQLDCGSLMISTAPIKPNTIDPQYFPVPKDFYGAPCSFSVIDYPIYYNEPTSVPVTIAQPVNFTSPSSSGSYTVNTGFEVLLSADAIDNNYPVTVTQECGTLAPFTYNDIDVGTSFTAVGPSGFVGSCTFSSSSNAIYNAATTNVTITIGKGSLSLSSPVA